jgi:predicted RNA-binding Zn ribbon-like protein
VRECPGSPGKACGWLFVDRTKNGSRIWCVGTLCGNRTRAHRRYERERDARWHSGTRRA